jgi:hypothetical protein
MRVLAAHDYQGTLCVEVDCLRDSWDENQAVKISVNYLRQQNASLA